MTSIVHINANDNIPTRNLKQCFEAHRIIPITVKTKDSEIKGFK